MRYRNIFLICTCILLWGSCKQQSKINESRTIAEDGSASDVTEEFAAEIHIDSLIAYFKQTYDLSPRQIKEHFGTPITIDSTRIQNVHTGKEEDYLYKFEYPKRTIVVYYATEIQRYFLEYVELRDIAELASFGFTPPITPIRLRQLLGPEHTVHQSPELGTLYQYTVQKDVEEHLFFVFKNDNLYAIQYQPYLD